MNKAKTIFQTIRLPFLILTPICIFLGVSMIINQNIPVDYHSLTLILIGAISAHISVNTLNEYLDFKSGLDLHTIKTPFSGGSGALPQNPEMQSTILFIAVLSLLVTLMIGSYFIYKQGFGLFPIGVIGVILILFYTNWINKSPILCLIAPGLGFSLIVIGSFYVLVRDYSLVNWGVVLVQFLLVNNLLLLNQYPDVLADKEVGRNHSPIAYGIKVSNRIYAAFLFTAITIIILLVSNHIIPITSLLALVSLSFGLYSFSGMIKYREKIGKHTKYLAANVVTTLLTPLILSVSLTFN